MFQLWNMLSKVHLLPPPLPPPPQPPSSKAKIGSLHPDIYQTGKCHTQPSLLADRNTRKDQKAVRAHLHPVTATSLRHHSQISSIVLVLYCYTKCLPLRVQLILLSLGNCFVTDSGAISQRCRRRVAVARCKWALKW